ncbi:MAG: hypothetical protein HZB68_02895 [Candidatus Aenigmarchaeota archaeon]|nr:hypothetical protein [Candidatus Aenigmarchaeota archaeon]
MFSQSWELVKRSFSVLRKDKEVMLFPVMSALSSIIIFALVLLPTVIYNNMAALSFLAFYFNTGLIICADIRLKGGDPTVRDGLSGATKNIGKIFAWSLIAATIGMLINAMTSNRKSLPSRLIGGVLGFSWGMLSFFVIPVMVFENVGPIDAIKRSGELIRKTWGENLAAQFSTGAIFFALALLGAVPLALAFYAGSVGMFAIVAGAAVLYWMLLAIVNSSLKGILIVSLYGYAKGNAKTPLADIAKNAFVKMS